MATNINLFTDKEATNWFKACIALNVTKEGLTNFLEKELQKVHSVVGTSCGKCCIEKLIKCPTLKYCKKTKGNNCIFHKSQQPQHCQICDKVKQNIVTLHRYGGPSWRNTHAENWAHDYWEIGKCFLPPDGYSSVSSVQESDFNGVISIMLNCLHFQTCLSSACISPPPPDDACLLEKVRQIGRVVRHTSDCKVTDADLQEYFQTLSTLLVDPNCLQHDPSSTIACARLRDLQNDRLSIKELGDLLKEAYRTLVLAKEAGERFSLEAERTLEQVTKAGERRLKSATHAGQQRLKIKTKVGENLLDRKARICEHRIESKTHDAERFLENKIQDGTHRIEYNAQNVIVRMQQASIETSQVDYERGVADLRRRLVEYYHDISSNVPLSVLDQSFDKRITDIYSTPKIHLIDIEKDGTRVKKEQVMNYEHIFYTHDKLNRRIYLQGDPGSGKSTFAAKLVHYWSHRNQPSSESRSENSMFNDALIIRNFKFIFFISLRDARGQTCVVQMIQKQLIDTMYSGDKRAIAYLLLHQIIETERCLVVRDGLDEWVVPDGSNLAEPFMAEFSNDRCTVLTTSRSWKLADERIKNSQIDILLEIEGIADPDSFTERILRCILDKRNYIETTASEIKSFILESKLTSLSFSPMLYTLVICTWVDKMGEGERLTGSSLCALYTTFLESLCKKVNATPGFFNDLNPIEVKCFSSTRYLQPIIQNVQVISKAAFHLLFSTEKETSIVFNDHQLSNYVSKSEEEFALKAGLISKRKTKKMSNASNSFIHKSMQEFLAAFHIARNAHLIDEIISGYLTRHMDAYLDISNVFKFLCGLNISAANKLSNMMYEQIARMVDTKHLFAFRSFQGIIYAGYREAVANENTGILFKLSHFCVNNNNLIDMYNIWTDNVSNAHVLALDIDDVTDTNMHSSPAHRKQTSHVEFNLASCLKLKSLNLKGSGLRLTDSASSVPSTLPVWIVLHIANSTQCVEPPPILPSIEHIVLDKVTCSSSWLRSLFNTLLNLDHKVECNLLNCEITSCIEDAVTWSPTTEIATLTCFKNTLNVLYFDNLSTGISTGMCVVFHGLNIKSLHLRGNYRDLNVNHTELLSRSLSSFTHLTELSFELLDYSPDMWKVLNGLNIKYLNLSGLFGGLNLKHLESLLQSISSLGHLEWLRIHIEHFSIGLVKVLHGLNIKSLYLIGMFGGLNIPHVEPFSQSLASLLHLETLSIEVYDDSPGLWDALHGLNIKSMSLNGSFGRFNVKNIESLSQSLASLTQLETLSIYIDEDSPVLWKGLHNLNIKSLSLSGRFGCFNVSHIELLSQSLLSLKQLETFSIYVKTYTEIQLPQSLKYLNVYCWALLPYEVRKLVGTLSARYRTVETNLEFGCASSDASTFERIPLNEYISIQQELETQKHLLVKRFRILDRLCKTDMFDYDVASACSVRGVGEVDDDTQDADSVQEAASERFVSGMSNETINRISIRLQITPALNARIINTCGSKT